MKITLYSFFIISIAISGCAGSNSIAHQEIKQGISGYIYIEKGNRMPNPGKQLNSPPGFATTVFIHPVTELNQLFPTTTAGLFQMIYTSSITSITTDSSGFFSVKLPTGKYSVFVKYEGGFYANWFNEKNQIAPVEVFENQVSKVKYTVSAGATY
ncbi:MAG: carboxypeptidase regulatory-like domain-containing protein [Chitinophagia bacterium]|nr:carboxypeptidase regulatory-like domain-containing protein [Chitinophagia bacterium]